MNLAKSHFKLKILLCGAFVLIELLTLSSICPAQDKPWTTKAPMPTARFWYSCEVVNGKIYVIGGAAINGAQSLATVEEYDPVTDTWTTKADIPTPRYNTASAVLDGKIYIIGGDNIFQLGWIDGLRTVEVYDPSSDTWDAQKTPMPTGRNGPSACVVNGIIYVIGGVYLLPEDPAGTVGRLLNVVEAYDPATDTWTTKAPMLTARWALSTPVINGKIYAMGGSAGGEHGLSTVELYDPETDTWTTKTSMPILNCYFGTGIVDGIIYTMGGWDYSPHSRVFTYDSEIDEWSEITAMPTARIGLGAGVVNGKIYAIGGTQDLYSSRFSINEVYDPHLDLLKLIEKIEVDNSYVKPGTDSVCIATKISDLTGITIMAYIEAHDQTSVDSIQLFDDGNHNDGNEDDGLYVNFWPVGSSEEPVFYVNIKITRIDMDTVINQLNNVARFTTIGPVTLEGYPFASSDTVFDPGDRINITLTLKNRDLTTTAPNIKAKLISLDTLVMVSAWSRTFGDLGPGEDSTSSYYSVTISDDWPGNSQLPILVEISSNDYVYWKDTIIIPVITDVRTLDDPGADPFKIYPNPTNDVLNIEINNSGNRGSKIEIFTITGELIYRKEYKKNHAHLTDQISLSDYAKGIYLVKVRQADTFYVRKVVIR